MARRHGTTAPTRLRVVALAAVAASAALGACGGSGYHYVKNSSKGAYFKLPDAWEIFDEQAFWEHPGRDLSDEEANVLQDVGWTVAFDADPRSPSVDNVLALAPAHPTGVAQVIPMTQDQHDQASLKLLRNLVTDVDALVEEGKAKVLDYEERTIDGFRGSRFVFEVDTEEGRVTFDQSAFMDRDAEEIYSLMISCTAACYEDNQDTIDDVAESWTLRER